MRLFLIPIALAMFASTPALAHAHLTGSTPAANAKLVEVPAEVAIDFSEALEPKFSAIEVDDAKGARVDCSARGSALFCLLRASRLW